MSVRRLLYRWVHPLTSLSAMLAMVAAASAIAFGWVGWEMLRQDRAAEEQRERERLESLADRAVRALDQLLTGIEHDLEIRAATSESRLANAPSESVVLVFDAHGIETVSPRGLLFYPALPTRPEPPASLFAAAEADEFQRQALPRAADAYRQLARSPDRAVRAAAMMRLGRVLRQLNRNDAALAVYREMASLDEVAVIGSPAGLVARDAEMRLLDQLGRQDEAATAARSLQHDLSSGRWPLTGAQYEHYVANATRVVPQTAAPTTSAIAVARGVSELWQAWRSAATPRGRILVGPPANRQLAVWREGSQASAAWLIPLDRLLSRLPAEARPDISLADHETRPARDARPHVTRTTTETGLPFTVLATGTSSPANTGALTRGRLVVLGFGVIVAFLCVATYFVGRAVKQEVTLARLQADFVSAVSHEFRTPLAAMRQLSELLAAGRVPLETRRQQYYDSLAAESRRLQRLVENLLEFGKLEAGARPYRVEPLDARALLEAAVDDFRLQLARPECLIEVTPGQPMRARVLADREAMTLALHNLLDNAVKYSQGRPVRVHCDAEGDRIAFSVSDAGPGIPADDQSRIFQKFVRGTSAAATSVTGTGVGLATVKLIVTGLGGDVRVASEPNRGSTFTLVLPAEAA